MRGIWLAARSTFLWIVSLVHFGLGSMLLSLMRRFLTAEQVSVLLCGFCRSIVRLTGARFEVRRAPGCEPGVPCFYVVNHVDIFDPFLIVAAAGGVTRGLELESHFRVPFYGWFMSAMDMVRVPNRPSRANLALMKQRTAEALGNGISLVVYPEGTRTRTGHVGPFRPGVFRMAVEFGTPIVPASVVGAYELKHVGSFRLSPARVVVHLHPAIEPGDDPVALCERVRQIVMEPVEAALSDPAGPVSASCGPAGSAPPADDL